jgi:hypothetical protein
MNAIWTLLTMLIYFADSLGPDGVVTGKVVCTAIVLAIFCQLGFAFIDWAECRHARQT